MNLVVVVRESGEPKWVNVAADVYEEAVAPPLGLSAIDAPLGMVEFERITYRDSGHVTSSGGLVPVWTKDGNPPPVVRGLPIWKRLGHAVARVAVSKLALVSARLDADELAWEGAQDALRGHFGEKALTRRVGVQRDIGDSAPDDVQWFRVRAEGFMPIEALG